MGDKSASIHVSNLSYTTSDESLLQGFADQGLYPKSARVIIDRDANRSKGFGFVEFQDADTAQGVLDQYQNSTISIDGRDVKVNPSRSGGRGGGGGRGRGGYGGGRGGGYGGRGGGGYGGGGYGGGGYGGGGYGGGGYGGSGGYGDGGYGGGGYGGGGYGGGRGGYGGGGGYGNY